MGPPAEDDDEDDDDPLPDLDVAAPEPDAAIPDEDSPPVEDVLEEAVPLPVLVHALRPATKRAQARTSDARDMMRNGMDFLDEK